MHENKRSPQKVYCTTRPAETQQEENEEGTRSIPNITPSPTAEPREHKVRFVSVGGFPLKSWKPSRQMALKPPSKKSTRPPQCMPQVYVSSFKVHACTEARAALFSFTARRNGATTCADPLSPGRLLHATNSWASPFPISTKRCAHDKKKNSPLLPKRAGEKAGLTTKGR